MTRQPRAAVSRPGHLALGHPAPLGESIRDLEEADQSAGDRRSNSLEEGRQQDEEIRAHLHRLWACTSSEMALAPDDRSLEFDRLEDRPDDNFRAR